MRPKVSFDSTNIWRRLELCKITAQAHGWESAEIMQFINEVNGAFSYEEAMEIIRRNFDITKDCL